MSVIEVVMISSPGFGLTVATAMWMAAEPDGTGVGVFRTKRFRKFLLQHFAEFPLGRS